MFNYSLISSEYPIFKSEFESNKIYWKKISMDKQLSILKKYYPIGETCRINSIHETFKYEFIIRDYTLKGGMTYPKYNSYLECGNYLLEKSIGYDFRLELYHPDSVIRTEFPSRILMNNNF